MHFKLLSDRDMKAIDALIDDFGGGEEICKKIGQLGEYETRKKLAGDKGYGEMLEQAEGYARGSSPDPKTSGSFPRTIRRSSCVFWRICRATLS